MIARFLLQMGQAPLLLLLRHDFPGCVPRRCGAHGVPPLATMTQFPFKEGRIWPAAVQNTARAGAVWLYKKQEETFQKTGLTINK